MSKSIIVFSNEDRDKQIKVEVTITEDTRQVKVDVDFGPGGTPSHKGHYAGLYEAFIKQLKSLGT